ncbi:hypothetical protein [Streptomyces sp. bgisy082]|uniref:hypothetical protein n=1 Tax=Streptomyces sp. bgisy082 TaxID=3413776 RepID=UPI003D73DCCF
MRRRPAAEDARRQDRRLRVLRDSPWPWRQDAVLHIEAEKHVLLLALAHLLNSNPAGVCRSPCSAAT